MLQALKIIGNMITSAFLYLGSLMISILLATVALIPGDDGFPQGVTDMVTFLGGYTGYAGTFFPLADLAIVVRAVLAFELFVLSFALLRWAVSFIPWVGGKGV